MRSVMKTANFSTAILARRLARFVGDCRGVSAVEFAMLLPVMMTLYLGSVEASQGIATNRKVTIDRARAGRSRDPIYRHHQCRHVEHPQRRRPRSSRPTRPPISRTWCRNSRSMRRARPRSSGATRSTAPRARSVRSSNIPASLAVPNYLSGAGRGPVQLQSDLRLRHDRHDDAERSNLHAAAAIDLDRAHGVVTSGIRNQINQAHA